MKMNTQNQIKRTLSQPESIEYVSELLKTTPFLHRSALAEAVCEQFGFFDTRGDTQLGGCVKALRKLEAAGHFILPAPSAKGGNNTPRRLFEPVPQPRDVPSQAGDVRGLTLVRVRTEGEMRIWNEMMVTEHPLGAGPFVGRQLRYLIGSEHGWLGGVGFAAAALQLADRDPWIGWDAEQRQAHLHGVVGMCRFLIRPSVHCRNLASKVLSMSMAVMPEDFEGQYSEDKRASSEIPIEEKTTCSWMDSEPSRYGRDFGQDAWDESDRRMRPGGRFF
jgi:hypothetical protein